MHTDPAHLLRFPNVSGSDPNGNPNTHLPAEALESIRRNGVCLKGTLFTPLTKYNTSTQSLNVQLRKLLDLHVNLVHGFTVPGLKTRHDNIDIVVIRSAALQLHADSAVPPPSPTSPSEQHSERL